MHHGICSFPSLLWFERRLRTVREMCRVRGGVCRDAQRRCPINLLFKGGLTKESDVCLSESVFISALSFHILHISAISMTADWNFRLNDGKSRSESIMGAVLKLCPHRVWVQRTRTSEKERETDHTERVSSGQLCPNTDAPLRIRDGRPLRDI